VDLCGCSEIAAAVAVQGPKVRGFIDQVFAGPARGGMRVTRPSELKKNQIALFGFGDEFAWVACTGYTGEDGFEVIEGVAHIEGIWNACVAAGAKPCGLGTRDTLRTEVCYPLYGHELDENTTPIEAGVGFFVALDKGDFVGRAVLAEQKANGVTKKCVAFKMAGPSPPPRPHCPLWSTGASAAQIGEVTSGTHSPSLGLGIGLGYLPPEFAKPGTPIEIEIRGRRYGAAVVPRPIYRKPV
jgi:aminomethyltransferase